MVKKIYFSLRRLCRRNEKYILLIFAGPPGACPWSGPSKQSAPSVQGRKGRSAVPPWFASAGRRARFPRSPDGRPRASAVTGEPRRGLLQYPQGWLPVGAGLAPAQGATARVAPTVSHGPVRPPDSRATFGRWRCRGLQPGTPFSARPRRLSASPHPQRLRRYPLPSPDLRSGEGRGCRRRRRGRGEEACATSRFARAVPTYSSRSSSLRRAVPARMLFLLYRFRAFCQIAAMAKRCLCGGSAAAQTPLYVMCNFN